MDLRFSEEDENFRREAVAWLEENLSGEFAVVRGRGGTGDEGSMIEERKAWERRLGEGGWIGLGWPKESGGRGLPLTQQVIFYEEYARAGGPTLLWRDRRADHRSRENLRKERDDSIFVIDGISS